MPGIVSKLRATASATRLLATFLQHFKGARLSFAENSQRAASLADRKRAEAFLAVFRPVFERYRESLTRSGTIDFHDMINRATGLVESGRYRSPFGYIMVDEFQDISPARARLLKALLDSAPDAQLFAVGDDWQAIYRFGGSDIAVMREFETWFGDYLRIDLETMFRTDDRIAKLATDFVLRNPAQIRKTVRPMREADRPAVHLGLCSGKHGFPAEITDDPLLGLVLAAPEAHPNAEERRLLYVAITRARRQVYLLAEGGPPSSFARELMHGRYDVNRVRPSAASRRALPAMQGGSPGALQKSEERGYFLWLFELAVLQAHATALSELRGWVGGKDGRRSALPRLW